MAKVTVQAIINLPQHGLRAGDIGEVDSDAIQPMIDLQRAAVVTAGKGRKKAAADAPVDPLDPAA